MKTVELDTKKYEEHFVNKYVLNKIGDLVSGEAKTRCPVDTGRLRESIDYEVIDDKVIIYADTPYALWVHEGTGAFALNGNGREGWWVYVKEPGAQVFESYQSTQPIRTLEEAKQVCNYLNRQFKADGSEKVAFYTQGQEPKQFLRKALIENEDKILDIIKTGGY